MTTVFIGGSRHVSRLPAAVTGRLDAVIEKGFAVVIGDADGADKAVQSYLSSKAYRNVVVFCMSGKCRNNVGSWPTREISARSGARGFEYYATKDRAMADEASHGLMLWDGKSKGTLNNVLNLTRQQKPVVVYVAPARAFRSLRGERDITELLKDCAEDDVARLERELGIGEASDRPLLR